MKLHLFFISIILSFAAFGQEADSLDLKSGPTADGELIVNAPFSLNELEARFIRLNEKSKKTSGYRIQFYSGSRQGANEAKVQLLSVIGGEEVYVLYQQPYFKTKIGDFRTKLEAEKFMREMGDACRGCFVVREQIEFPKLD